MVYPESNAYRSETGGVMSALRDLTVEQSTSPPSPSFAPTYFLSELTSCRTPFLQ